ncbi:MAG: putative signal transducing protein [Burkholderiales bacterium]
MKRIFSSHDLISVHHARNLLEAAGIAAVVRNELLSSAMGELPPVECQAELWVIDEVEADRAERILREGRLPQTVDARSWRCPSCGETLEAQFTQCWRCGTTRAAESPLS